jgi:hypothetical protein
MKRISRSRNKIVREKLFQKRNLGKILYLVLCPLIVLSMAVSFYNQWVDIHSDRNIIVLFHHFSSFLILFLLFNGISLALYLAERKGWKLIPAAIMAGGIILAGLTGFIEPPLTNFIFSNAMQREGYIVRCEDFDREKTLKFGKILVHEAYCKKRG